MTDFYTYSGELSGGRRIQIGGAVLADIEDPTCNGGVEPRPRLQNSRRVLRGERLLPRRCHSGLSHPRQYGLFVFRTFVTGSFDRFGGGGKPHRIVTSSRSLSRLRTTGAI
jgi:hypothetical protein